MYFIGVYYGIIKTSSKNYLSTITAHLLLNAFFDKKKTTDLKSVNQSDQVTTIICVSYIQVDSSAPPTHHVQLICHSGVKSLLK